MLQVTITSKRRIDEGGSAPGLSNVCSRLKKTHSSVCPSLKRKNICSNAIARVTTIHHRHRSSKSK
ncbi:unnamed protein product [Spodoptera exigua]|nr:unnamed protein product [Spodoptera exigua]